MIYSFDIGKTNDLVIQCDIAKLPLPDKTLDVGIFCLSLMGTNFSNFLREANRVLKVGGTLFVAEVLSRFTNFDLFIKYCKESAGFKLVKATKLKDFFYVLVFTKVKNRDRPVEEAVNEGEEEVKKFSETLKPCLYKKR